MEAVVNCLSNKLILRVKNKCCKFRYFKNFVQTQQLSISCYVCDKVFEEPKFTILINLGTKYLNGPLI